MKKQILIVEDDQANVELIDILLDSGFEVSLLRNACKFMETVAHLNPGLIVLNMELSVANNWNSFDFPFKEIADSDIPIIIISDSAETIFRSFPDHIQACIINPPDSDIVRDKALEIIN